MKNKASATWKGDLKSGNGTISLNSAPEYIQLYIFVAV